MIPVIYLPRQKLVFKRAREGVISCTIETRKGINLSSSKTIVVINHNQETVKDSSLEVEHDGQTQFNVFGNAAHHVLIINGVEYHTYSLQQITSNWKLVWTGDFTLQTTDKLIFRVFNT